MACAKLIHIEKETVLGPNTVTLSVLIISLGLRMGLECGDVLLKYIPIADASRPTSLSQILLKC